MSDRTSGDVAVVGTYVPRHCGIASFTADLVHAIGSSSEESALPIVLAITEPSGQYQYPAEVKFEIRQNIKADYARAADFVNFSQARVVSIQHEYGIFGGDDGKYILEFIHALRVPSMVTMHTVLRQPSQGQLAIVQRLAERCEAMVVMSQVAANLLEDAYGVPASKIRIIPHGIPVMDPQADQLALKAKFGVGDQPLLLTFGLLSANKGIETVICALPAVVKDFPELVYLVVGATHPEVLRREGEAYRSMLEREAEELGVRDHVAFRSQYVPDGELLQYLQAADIFVSPYLNEEQVTSGALSYAMGAGPAVVSTPYWHAQELLSEGRGYLFPFRDHAALGQTLLRLLESSEALARARMSAREFAHAMSWPSIGSTYFRLSREIRQTAGEKRLISNLRKPAAASSLPELRLDHLFRMTDDTGIVQHATYSVPARRSGYCVDDNARALIVAVEADRLHNSAETRALVTTYLSYILCSQEDDGNFLNFMSYDRVLEGNPPSDDCLGRAIWALGVTTKLAEDEGCRLLAREMLVRALPHARDLGPRGTALTILGLVELLKVDPGGTETRSMLDACVAKLRDCFRENATDDWRWFEPTLTYDNAILPFALFAAYGVTAERAILRDARESLEFIEDVCFEGDQLRLVGNTGWHSRGGEKACADEQAIDAAAFVLAFRCAYEVTRDRHYLLRMHKAFAWFLGANRLGVPIYDFATGGCRDGMGVTEVNQNQGAESTLCFLTSLLRTLEVAGAQVASTNAQMGSDLPS
jgi:glycosyltransferase involved in cell wall biosynthesis